MAKHRVDHYIGVAMSSVDTVTVVRDKFRALLPVLDERMRRLWAANEARALGWGGIATVAEATGLSRTTIRVGLKELHSPNLKPRNDFEGVRQKGAGRPSLDQIDGTLRQALKSLLLASTEKDPHTPLHWTCKSTRRLAQDLAHQGHQVSHATLATFIRELGYRLQSTRGSATKKNQHYHDTQFRVIQEQVKAFIRLSRPVVAVETLRKAPFTHSPAKSAEKCFDGVNENFAKRNRLPPHGVWQNNSLPQDGVAFAIDCLESWWFKTGINLYPYTQDMLVIIDNSGGGGARFRRWEKALQGLARSAALHMVTYALPPGAYQWTQLIHTQYHQIVENWPNRLQRSQDVFISLIGDSTDNANTNSFSSLLDEANYAAISLNAEG